MTVLAGSIPSDGVEDVSEDVLDELRGAFAGDESQSQSRPQVRPEPVVTSEPTIPPVTAESAVVEESVGAERIVIEDDALRSASDLDFPADVQSQSVHYAPTSTRVVITDDSFVGAEVGSTTGIVSSTATIIDDAPFGRRGWFARLRGRVAGAFSRTQNRRKAILVVLASVIGGGALVVVVLASPIVAVRKVQIEGVTYAAESRRDRGVGAHPRRVVPRSGQSRPRDRSRRSGAGDRGRAPDRVFVDRRHRAELFSRGNRL
ncbi:MAG: hypothetical protein EBT21_04315 [Actinobacteria bacterium]|nr:hypothetical protein [Actinomycetota bacterium]